MWLTRLMLSKKDKRVIRDISDCYQLHRTVMSMFPSTGKSNVRKDFGVLYRYEQREGSADQLLMQSIEKPDTSRLPGGYLHTGTTPAVSYMDITKILTRIKGGTTLRFKIRANPTKRANPEANYSDRKSGHKECNGIRYPIRDDEQLLKWLAQKGLQHGFEPLSVELVETSEKRSLMNEKRVIPLTKVDTDTDQVAATGSGPAGRVSIKFNSVIFEGYLKVVDPDKFRGGIKAGIGTEKAFGFGMLSFGFVK